MTHKSLTHFVMLQKKNRNKYLFSNLLDRKIFWWLLNKAKAVSIFVHLTCQFICHAFGACTFKLYRCGAILWHSLVHFRINTCAWSPRCAQTLNSRQHFAILLEVQIHPPCARRPLLHSGHEPYFHVRVLQPRRRSPFAVFILFISRALFALKTSQQHIVRVNQTLGVCFQKTLAFGFTLFPSSAASIERECERDEKTANAA
jgi:hypothetical protein